MDLQQQILSAQCPGITATIGDVTKLLHFDCTANKVTIKLAADFPGLWVKSQLDAVVREICTKAGITDLDFCLIQKILPHRTQKGIDPHPQIKNIIPVASGKGGVGKSTTAVNLALALKQQGARVGILDADIYGPSLPTMLAVNESPVTTDKKTLMPIEKYGLQTMSIGYLLDQDDTPAIWRGPMVTSALMQLLNDTNWTELDYLIVDLPPGTGDIQLSLLQKVPVSGAVIVSTPQNVALMDAKKALTMFRKLKVPVLGVVENMSYYQCPECGHQDHIFGTSGAIEMAEHYNAPVLGQIPLTTSIQQQMDQGTPTVQADPESSVATAYNQLAFKVSAQLALQERDYSVKIPKIVVATE